MARRRKAPLDSHLAHLGDTIKRLRGTMTQGELAEQLQVKRDIVINMEGGTQFPDRNKTAKLLSVLANTDDKEEQLVNALIRAYLGGEEFGAYQKMLIGTQSSGVLRAFRKSERDHFFPLLPYIKAAEDDLFFLGYNLIDLMYYTELLKIKANKMPVRLLMPDTCEKELMVTIARFWNEVPYLFQQFAFYYGEWAKVWKEAPIQVRACPTYPPFTALIFDRKRGIIELYMREWSVSGFRMLLELDFEHGAQDVMHNLEELWNDATPLSSQEKFDTRIVAAEKLAAEVSA